MDNKILPVNRVIVQRINSEATGFATMVFHIKESVAEHNVITELLREIRHKYPGPWYSFLSEIANTTSPNLEKKAKPMWRAPTPTMDERLLDEEKGVAPV